MESTTTPPPPYHRSDHKSQTKSASRLARTNQFDEEEPPLLPSLDCSPKMEMNLSSPKPQSSLKIHELLLLSPSPLRKSSRTRLAEMASEEPVEPNGSRRRCKTRNSPAGCASPRNGRRLRRRLEPEIREEKDFGVGEEIKPRKIRHSGRSKKEKLSLVPLNPSPTHDGDGCNLDRIGQLFTDLVMWNDVAKSSLWFGFGSLCFISSCFTQGIKFSIFSFISQLALLCLGISFLSSSICQRINIEKREITLKEDDILRAARVILPAANLVLSKTRWIFSGEPSTTLKVAPFLLLGAEYGHLITLWRLCALGFFISFTGPKLYSNHSAQINKKADYLKLRVLEAWRGCTHKKIVAASVATAFWNLATIKTRIFAAFISLVIVRYYRQFSEAKPQEEDEAEEGQQEQALVLVETKSKKP
ncbi:hypothetical protein LguiA_035139 [Lonicera macranthoides]